jgi:AAA+ ATPase superfamily predicted ATPase
MEIALEINNNLLLIGNRNTGKTALLKKAILSATANNYCILLFDSATDHINKSILNYCKSQFADYLFITSPPKELIYSNIQDIREVYPYHIIANDKQYPLYLFDVSKYLEDGFLFDNVEERENTRQYYKLLVNQILTVMFHFVSNKNYVVIMDEIEFLPAFLETIQKYNSKEIYFVNALHTTVSCNKEILSLFNQIKLCKSYC